MVEKRGAYRLLVRKLKERNIFEDLGIDGKIILKVSSRSGRGGHGLN